MLGARGLTLRERRGHSHLRSIQTAEVTTGIQSYHPSCLTGKRVDSYLRISSKWYFLSEGWHLKTPDQRKHVRMHKITVLI